MKKNYEKNYEIDEFEIERKTNLNLERVLFASECQLWDKIRTGGYSWVEIDSDRKERLFKLIEMYRAVFI